MSTNSETLTPPETAKVFADPVSYLLSLGMTAVLIDDTVPKAA